MKLDVNQFRIDSISFLGLAVTGINENNNTHRDWLHAFSKSLTKIPGIVKADVSFQERHILVGFDLKKLSAREISVSQYAGWPR